MNYSYNPNLDLKTYIGILDYPLIQYLIYEVENLKKDSKTTDNTSSDNSALEEKISTLQTNLDKLNSDFANYKNQVDSNTTTIDTLNQEVAELKTKE